MAASTADTLNNTHSRNVMASVPFHDRQRLLDLHLPHEAMLPAADRKKMDQITLMMRSTSPGRSLQVATKQGFVDQVTDGMRVQGLRGQMAAQYARA